MHARLGGRTILLGLLGAASCLAAGCMPPSAEKQQGSSAGSSDTSRPSLMHRYTRDVKDAAKELEEGRARQGGPQSTGSNVIRYPFDAALGARATIAKAQIQQAVNTYWALNGHYPKDYKEFKREILDANPGLKLPDLPDHQEYGYDAEKHELIILEYPDRKE